MTSAKNVAILNLGCSNLFSLQSTIERLGYDTEIVTTPAGVEDATHLMIPGVGKFAAGTAALDERKLRQPLLDRLKADRRTLAICLGMQLLFQGSDESPGAVGLGFLPGKLEPIDSESISPNFGWDVVGSPEEGRYMYFAHSYCFRGDLPDWSVRQSGRSHPFAAQAARGNILACQFHPEISGRAGEALLTSWLKNSGGTP